MPTATLTSKGQVTIPASVREALGIHAGDRVQFVEGADGTYEIRPLTRSVKTLKGFFGQWEAPAVSVEEMTRAAADAAAEANR